MFIGCARLTDAVPGDAFRNTNSLLSPNTQLTCYNNPKEDSSFIVSQKSTIYFQKYVANQLLNPQLPSDIDAVIKNFEEDPNFGPGFILTTRIKSPDFKLDGLGLAARQEPYTIPILFLPIKASSIDVNSAFINPETQLIFIYYSNIDGDSAVYSGTSGSDIIINGVRFQVSATFGKNSGDNTETYIKIRNKLLESGYDPNFVKKVTKTDSPWGFGSATPMTKQTFRNLQGPYPVSPIETKSVIENLPSTISLESYIDNILKENLSPQTSMLKQIKSIIENSGLSDLEKASLLQKYTKN